MVSLVLIGRPADLHIMLIAVPYRKPFVFGLANVRFVAVVIGRIPSMTETPCPVPVRLCPILPLTSRRGLAELLTNLPNRARWSPS